MSEGHLKVYTCTTRNSLDLLYCTALLPCADPGRCSSPPVRVDGISFDFITVGLVTPNEFGQYIATSSCATTATTNNNEQVCEWQSETLYAFPLIMPSEILLGGTHLEHASSISLHSCSNPGSARNSMTGTLCMHDRHGMSNSTGCATIGDQTHLYWVALLSAAIAALRAPCTVRLTSRCHA